jgi:ABC-type bacteriocin/lantibiotic exporter with double-glycine peptidase domain
VKVELTPFQQSRPYTCVAACLRVVLAALGADYPGDDLARACNTDLSGATLSDAANAVRSLGFNALFLPEATFEMLSGWLQRGVPMIVGIAVDDPVHGVTGGHAVVVCGIEQGQVIVVDPAIGAERRLEVEMFLRAWRRRNNRGLIVLR